MGRRRWVERAVYDYRSQSRGRMREMVLYRDAVLAGRGAKMIKGVSKTRCLGGGCSAMSADCHALLERAGVCLRLSGKDYALFFYRSQDACSFSGLTEAGCALLCVDVITNQKGYRDAVAGYMLYIFYSAGIEHRCDYIGNDERRSQ
ncbi:hypothetical protein Tco_1104060 [Tanacetum coccineum]